MSKQLMPFALLTDFEKKIVNFSDLNPKEEEEVAGLLFGLFTQAANADDSKKYANYISQAIRSGGSLILIDKIINLTPEILDTYLIQFYSNLHEVDKDDIFSEIFIQKLLNLPHFSNTLLVKQLSTFVSKLSPNNQSYFLNTLFSLPKEDIAKILNKNLFDLINSLDNKLHPHLLVKLSELPENIIQQIFINSESFIKLINTTYTELTKVTTASVTELGLILCKSGLKLYLTDLNEIFKVRDGSRLELISYVSDPLSLDLEEQQDADNTGLIVKLFTKIYYLEPDTAKRKAFASEIKKALKVIVSAEEVIFKILEQSYTDGGEIFFSTHNFLGRGFAGFYRNNNVLIATGNQAIEEILNTLIHESTHKLIENKFHSTFPYYKHDTSFEEIRAAIDKQSKHEYIIYSRDKFSCPQNELTWLLQVILGYNPECFASEILPHFAGHIAGHIARSALKKQNNNDGISKNFSEIIWIYLYKQLFDQSAPPLPQLYHRSIDNDELELAAGSSMQDIEAFNLIKTEPHDLNLLKFGEAGQLALKSLPILYVRKLIEELFGLPPEYLNKFLTDHFSGLLTIEKNTGVEKLQYLNSSLPELRDKLLELPIEKLIQLMQENKEFFIKQYSTFSENIYALNNAVPALFIENFFDIYLSTKSSDYKDGLLSELFRCSSNLLNPWLNQNIGKLTEITGLGNLQKYLPDPTDTVVTIVTSGNIAESDNVDNPV